MSRTTSRLRTGVVLVVVLGVLTTVPAAAWATFHASRSASMELSTATLTPPTGISQTACTRSGNNANITVSWTAAARATAYNIAVTSNGSTTSVQVTTTSHTFTVDRRNTNSLTVTSVRSAWTSAPSPAYALPGC